MAYPRAEDGHEEHVRERAGHGEVPGAEPPGAGGQAPAEGGRGVPPGTGTGRDRGRAHRRRRQARRPWYVREAALTLVLVVVTIGLVVVSQDYWRRGLLVVGSALVGAGALRLLLPTRPAGLLAVRSRLFDVVMLVTLGFAVIGLTLAVPLPGSP